MSVTLEIERDDDTGKILTAYLKVNDRRIARTVEIEHGKCVVDEADDGSVVGVEFILPTAIRVAVEKVADRYNDPSISRKIDDLLACV